MVSSSFSPFLAVVCWHRYQYWKCPGSKPILPLSVCQFASLAPLALLAPLVPLVPSSSWISIQTRVKTKVHQLKNQTTFIYIPVPHVDSNFNEISLHSFNGRSGIRRRVNVRKWGNEYRDHTADAHIHRRLGSAVFTDCWCVSLGGQENHLSEEGFVSVTEARLCELSQ